MTRMMTKTRYPAVQVVIVLAFCATVTGISAQEDKRRPDSQQQDGSPPRFSHVTIRRARPDDMPGKISRSFAGIEMHQINIEHIIRFAYRWLGPIKGSDRWIRAYPYNVSASANHAQSDDQIRLMVQSLLADEFHFSFHQETRPEPVYLLRMGTGAGLSPSNAETSNAAILGLVVLQTKTPDLTSDITQDRHEMGRAGDEWTFSFQAVTMAQFSEWLSELLDLPVLDRSGIRDGFDFKLTLHNDRGTGPSWKMMGNGDPAACKYYVQNVEDQLGLRLSRDQSAVNSIIVDHIDKTKRN